MIHKMKTVRMNHNVPTTAIAIQPMTPSMPSAPAIVMSHKTTDNWACASDNAHRRRYEAVCEMHPRQNSIV